jgi:hypothetical protein
MEIFNRDWSEAILKEKPSLLRTLIGIHWYNFGYAGKLLSQFLKIIKILYQTRRI